MSVSEAFVSLQRMRLYTIDQYKSLLVSEVVNNCLGDIHYRCYSPKNDIAIFIILCGSVLYIFRF